MDRDIRNFSDTVLRAVKRKMFGMDEVVRLSLVAFYTGGHVLLEGNPGFGKTELVKTLGDVLKLPFGRIQFTPDLMPADITGTFMPDLDNRDSRALKFRPGPIFTSLLLADEINRATPKTQSAMLEAMAEQQVTVLGEKRSLDAPFMVLATQNPIDHEGTYNLPEAQADRFMFKITMPVPNDDTLRRIIKKQAGRMAKDVNDDDAKAPLNLSLLPQNTDDSRKKHQEISHYIKESTPLPVLEEHIRNMFLASNRRFDELIKVDKSLQYVEKLVNLLTYGLGPRAAIALTLGAKAWFLMFVDDLGVDNANDVALARVVIPILRHRIKVDLDWEDRYQEIIQDNASKSIWHDDIGRDDHHRANLFEKLLADFCWVTAPQASHYPHTLETALRQMINERGGRLCLL